MAQLDSLSNVREPLPESCYELQTDSDLDPLIEAIDESRFVLLGEASHGTHEFYTWRTAITKKLIEEKGFSFIAVEGDWPDCYRINRFVKARTLPGEKISDILAAFKRWPTWMWANWEVAALAEWLREHNSLHASHRKVGFYGLDVYSLWESMEVMVDYLRKTDPDTARLAVNAMQCFEPYGEEMAGYAWASHQLSEDCRHQVVDLLREVRIRAPQYDGDPEAQLNASVNALVIANAESYYRSMLDFGDKTWNLRDTHMVNVLDQITDFHGVDAKAIVWGHNSHVGDARATDMKRRGLLNVGQLLREANPAKDVFIVGFSTYEGSVIASRKWGAPMEEMKVPAAIEGSIEHHLHRKSPANQLILLHDNEEQAFSEWKGHRAIGVVYQPWSERGNYVPTRLAQRYDALVHIDSTQALHPLHLRSSKREVPDTYPFGV